MKAKCKPCRKHSRECCVIHCPTCRRECAKIKTLIPSGVCTLLASFSTRKVVR